MERYEFDSEGDRLVGNLHLPQGDAHGVAILTGPLTSVKEQATGAWGSSLAERGFVALSFDHRYFGESAGQPRQLENPAAKIADIEAAAASLHNNRRFASMPMFAVGICAGGGYMARAVAAQPLFSAFAGVAGYYAQAIEQSTNTAAIREPERPRSVGGKPASKRGSPQWQLTTAMLPCLSLKRSRTTARRAEPCRTISMASQYNLGPIHQRLTRSAPRSSSGYRRLSFTPSEPWRRRWRDVSRLISTMRVFSGSNPLDRSISMTILASLRSGRMPLPDFLRRRRVRFNHRRCSLLRLRNEQPCSCATD